MTRTRGQVFNVRFLLNESYAKGTRGCRITVAPTISL